MSTTSIWTSFCDVYESVSQSNLCIYVSPCVFLCPHPCTFLYPPPLCVSMPPWDTGTMCGVRVPTYRNRVVIFPLLSWPRLIETWKFSGYRDRDWSKLDKSCRDRDFDETFSENIKWGGSENDKVLNDCIWKYFLISQADSIFSKHSTVLLGTPNLMHLPFHIFLDKVWS